MPKIGYKKSARDFNLRDNESKYYINENRFKYAILEKVDEIKFENFGKTIDYTNWDKGRLFGDKAEIKWNRIYRSDDGNSNSDEFHIVVISDEELLPEGFCEFECDNLHIEKKRKVFLWGEKDRSTCSWFEARIPHLLHYPGLDFSKNKDRVKIILHEYQFEEKPLELKNKINSTIYRFVRLIQV